MEIKFLKQGRAQEQSTLCSAHVTAIGYRPALRYPFGGKSSNSIPSPVKRIQAQQSKHIANDDEDEWIVGRIGRATASDTLCRGFDPCRQRPRGVAVDFGPEQSGWLINQLDDPSLSGQSLLSTLPIINNQWMHMILLMPFTDTQKILGMRAVR